MLDALQKAAQGLHGVADALDRIKAVPQITAQVAIKPAAGSLSKALAEELDGGQAEAFIRKLRERTGG